MRTEHRRDVKGERGAERRPRSARAGPGARVSARCPWSRRAAWTLTDGEVGEQTRHERSVDTAEADGRELSAGRERRGPSRLASVKVDKKRVLTLEQSVSTCTSVETADNTERGDGGWCTAARQVDYKAYDTAYPTKDLPYRIAHWSSIGRDRTARAPPAARRRQDARRTMRAGCCASQSHSQRGSHRAASAEVAGRFGAGTAVGSRSCGRAVPSVVSRDERQRRPAPRHAPWKTPREGTESDALRARRDDETRAHDPPPHWPPTPWLRRAAHVFSAQRSAPAGSAFSLCGGGARRGGTPTPTRALRWWGRSLDGTGTRTRCATPSGTALRGDCPAARRRA
jgi:hypothetical protein